MMYQGLQRALAQQPQGGPGGITPQGMPPQGARPPMPGGPGGQPAGMGGGAPWQGMGNGWLQQLKGLGQQMGMQPPMPQGNGADPSVRGPHAMRPTGQPDPVAQQAQATEQQGQAIARQQGRALIAQDDPRMRGMTR
jgi:hypothetical protein